MAERELKNTDRSDRAAQPDEQCQTGPREDAYCVGDPTMTDAEILIRHWCDEG